MKNLFLATILCCCIATSNAQDVKQFFIGAGISPATHQNQTFSLSSISGIGGSLQLGYSRQAKNLFRVHLDIAVQSASLNDLESTKSLIVEPDLNFAWMKGIQIDGANRLYIGGDLEGSILFRSSSNLGNNGSSLMYNNTLSVASRIERPLGESGWQLGGELSVGLLSWVKINDGYAFSAPQDFLTEGQFNYDEDVSTAFYKYGEWAPIGKFTRLKTNVSLFKDGEKARWGASYSWKMKAYEPFTNGQMVQGTHGINFFIGFKLGRKKADQENKN